MKTINKIFCALIVLTTIMSSCDVDKINDLKNNFLIAVDVNAVDNKKEIAVSNANDGSTAIDGLAITLSGDNLSDIYTSDGSAALNFVDGNIVIGLDKNVTPTEANPINVTATITATGYVSKTLNLVFDGTALEAISVPLLEKANLPENVVIEEKVEEVTGGTTAADIVIVTEKADETENLSTITVPANTEVKDKDGNTVDGSLSVTVDSYELTADSGSDFNAFDEVPEATTDSGDAITPTSMINIAAKVGSENVVPENISIETEENQELFIVLSDGTAIKVPTPAAKSIGRKSNINILFFVAIRNLLTQFQLERELELGRGFRFIVGRIIEASTVCSTKSVTVTNNGASGEFTFSIKEGATAVFSTSRTVFAGESTTISGLSLSTIKNYSLVVSAKTVNGTVETYNSAFSCGDSNIEISNTTAMPVETLNIPISAACPSISVQLANTTIKYKVAGSSSNYVIYGKTNDAAVLDSNLPTLANNTNYVFSVFHKKSYNTENEPKLGSRIKTLVASGDSFFVDRLDDICDRVEDQNFVK